MKLVVVAQSVAIFIFIIGAVPVSSSEVENGCPTSLWFTLTNGTCTCTEMSAIKCAHSVNHSRLQVKLGYCMTSNGEPTLRACPYFLTNVHLTIDHGYYDIPTDISGKELTNVTCGKFNRQDINCARCIEGYGPAIFSDSVTCVECSKYRFGWFAYLVLQLLLETIVFIILATLKSRKVFSVINVLTFYWQTIFYAITTNSFLYGKLLANANTKLLQFLLTLYGVWNLDFTRYLLPFMCITDTTTAINTLWFDFIVSVYPFLLCVLVLLGIHMHKQNNRMIIFLLRPFGRLVRREWDPKDSAITTFAVFFVLGYSKLLFTCLKLLNGVRVYHKDGTLADNKLVLYYDPSIKYLSGLHAPYIIVSVIILITCILIPPLLLLLHPIRCCRNRLGFQRSEFLSKTINMFQGFYKNGTEGTYDYRIFSALYMILKICIACEYIFVVVSYDDGKNTGLPWAITGLVLIGFGALYFTVEPFRESWMNKFDGFILTLLGLLALTITFDDQFVYAIALAISLIPWAIVGTATSTKLTRWTLNIPVMKRMKRKLKMKFERFIKSDNRYMEEEEPLLEESLSDNMPDRIVNPSDYPAPELHIRSEASRRSRSMSVPTYGVV